MQASACARHHKPYFFFVLLDGMSVVQRAILVVAAGLGLTCGVTGDTCGQFWPVGGLLEAGVVVLRVGVKCWAMPRVREKRWDH